MKQIVLSILFISITSIIYAQNSKLQGTVTDADNGQPIPFANIYLPQLEKGTNTDENGTYVLENVPKGNYKIVVSTIGYKTFSQAISVDNNSTHNWTLQPSAIEMDEVIVSTPFHKLQSENVMKVERQSLEQLKTKGAMTLSDGITNISGVESVTTGVGIGKPVIRGLSSNRVLVYTQGIRLENQQFGGEHGLGINQAGIESVEVIKGPASLLYGSDALGGVLYLNPEKYAQQNKTDGDANINYFTNTNGVTANAGFKASGDKIKFLVRGAYGSHADYEAGNGIYTTNSRFNEYDIKSGFGYQDSKFKTDVRYNYNRSNLGIPEEIGVQNRDRDLLLPYQEIDNHIISAKNTLFFNNSSLDVTLGYIANNRREYEDHHHHEEDEHEHAEEGEEHEHGDEAALDMRLHTLSYNVLYHIPKMGNFETIIGVQGMHQTNENFGEEMLIPDATTVDFGVMATTHYHMEKSDIQLGLRYDTRTIDGKETGEVGGESYFPEFDKNFNSFNASAGYRATIAEKIIARINFATGFRAPNLAELASNGNHSGANRFEIGNVDLTNEQNFQTDVSLEYENKHFEFFINGFYNAISDYIYLEPTGDEIDGQPVYQYVQNDSRLYGGEVGFHLHPHPFDWLHFESSFETVTGKLDDTDEYLPLIPANKLTNTFRVEMKDGALTKKYAFLTLQNVFNQNNVGTFETRTGGYSLVNIGLGATINPWNQPLSIKLTANNLLDKEYISHLSRLKPDGIYNIGRNINIGLSVPF
ncbi:TonB-dependent receptor [Galbibacter pacificus]|uniref:TonB-dependent receptor n=1 Tax=Galbibacter pacificus TaxID=2996052 RepID=A0ABT6FQ64_9FLAO|nr:TonB-dependent receptor [Galbibacter pacificus]MDG3582120.1 TonB-dependent receptor [Galbibacter pacificus]MDG3585404.1 TonB-dependent receptor [Galbibacter pacificus]